MDASHSSTRATTLQNIADRCGLSLFTVSLALRGDGRVKPATAARVRQAADALGYDPARNQAARQMAFQRHGRAMIHHVVALYIPSNLAEVPYYNQLFWGVLHGLTEAGFAMLVAKLPHTKGTSTPDLTALFHQGAIDGIIVPENPANDPEITALRRLGQRELPLVSMIWPGDTASSVAVDDEGGMHAATRHLLELGHRDILYLYQETAVLGAHRLAGIRRAFRDAGLDPAAHLHVLPSFPGWVDARHLREHALPGPAAAHPLCVWLQAHPHVRALLAWNDGVALHAWQLLEQAGWRIPEDISLIGFDDAALLVGANGENLLTSVHVPLREIGEQAAALMVHLVTDTPDAHVHRVLPATLALRASTAPPPTG